jgi:hypothetical protein
MMRSHIAHLFPATNTQTTTPLPTKEAVEKEEGGRERKVAGEEQGDTKQPAMTMLQGSGKL